MTTRATFQPRSAAQALLDWLYDIKFSKHTVLIVVLLSMVYTVYRTEHWLAAEFGLSWLVSWPAAIFVEALVLAASAYTFGALRAAFIAELKDADASRARLGIAAGALVMLAAFVALLFMAWSDAWRLTGLIVPTLIMTMIQFSQMLLVIGMISSADLEERARLRVAYADYKKEEAQAAANECPYCHKEVSAHNRKRHMDACPMREA
jgi:hypothetical protein